MRGKASSRGRSGTFLRITPAYAGKSRTLYRWINRMQDHPRLCGEKTVQKFRRLNFQGSPPPMRGKAEPCRRMSPDYRITPAYAGKSIWNFNNQTVRRITPAYAGKSTWKYMPFVTSQDHPRLCGEKTKKIPKQRYFFHQPASFSFSLQYT